jgi:hypothetical protein
MLVFGVVAGIGVASGCWTWRAGTVLGHRAGRCPMHAVIRTYSGASAKKLFDLIEERKREVESLIRPIKGFVSYSLLRTTDGGASVTVCQDKAGCDESAQVAREWIQKNASNTGASPPMITEGTVILNLK